MHDGSGEARGKIESYFSCCFASADSSAIRSAVELLHQLGARRSEIFLKQLQLRFAGSRLPPCRRRLSRYMRRWLVERFFAWIQWQRRILVRWEYHAHNFLGFVQLACLVILFKRF
jgi:transposase